VTSDDAVVAVLTALESAAVPFMIVGSLASNFHGIPRSTRDADFVVNPLPSGLGALAAQLPPELTLDAQTGFETVTGTLRHVVSLSGSAFVCELFMLSDDPHDRERFARRMPTVILGRRAWVASAEDMILTKLRWLRAADRSKDRDDIRNILAVQGSALDWVYIRRWNDTHGTASLLEQIRATVPRNP
jgi:hypothetical protein